MASDRWYIRDIDPSVKKKIRRVAFELGVTVGEAMKIIVEEWEAKKKT